MSDDPLTRLRKQCWPAVLPDSIDIPPTGDRPGVTKPITAATVDDVAFAIQALTQQSSALYRQIEALRQIHDLARRAGALGAMPAVAAAVQTVEGA